MFFCRGPIFIVIVELPEPGAGIGFALKLTATPLGCPVADSVMALSKAPSATVVIVDLTLPPGGSTTTSGESDIVKFGDDAVVTVSVTVTVFVAPPPVPVTVMG